MTSSLAVLINFLSNIIVDLIEILNILGARIIRRSGCISAVCFSYLSFYLFYLGNILFLLSVAPRKIESQFSVKVFDSKFAGMILNRKNWYVSNLDSDTV